MYFPGDVVRGGILSMGGCCPGGIAHMGIISGGMLSMGGCCPGRYCPWGDNVRGCCPWGGGGGGGGGVNSKTCQVKDKSICISWVSLSTCRNNNLNINIVVMRFAGDVIWNYMGRWLSVLVEAERRPNTDDQSYI